MPNPDDALPKVKHPPRFPIVLCHGLLGFDKIGIQGFVLARYFNGIPEDLQAQGCTVHITEVSPSSHVRVRANQLKKQIFCHDGKVNLIAHSMGGLDARYMISRLDGAERVASLTTIATPHRGTAVADWGLENLGDKLNVMSLLELLGMDTAAFHNLTRAYCAREFNPETPNHPGVKYFSLGASKSLASMFVPLIFSGQILSSAEGPNDGLVSVESAKWGEYLGTLQADHLDEVNWGPLFDARKVYREIAIRLAEEGL